MRKISFVLGNGTSRKSINPLDLKKHGTIYGCNALYREFTPDYLIAVDTKMIVEINKSQYQRTNQVWTNPNKAFSKFVGFNYFNPSKGWSSGPTALWMASNHGADEIYILGFDYQGLGQSKDKINNIYADTHNYKKSNDKATYYGNWLKQTVATISKFSKKRYIRVIEENSFVPSELSKLSNLTHISTEEFKEFFTL